MLLPLLFPLLLSAQTPSAPAEPAKAPAPEVQPDARPLESLTFASATYTFVWDKVIPVNLEVDGFRVKTIFFDEREPTTRLLQGRKYGHRAQLEATNTSGKPKTPGFAVAVMDVDGRLLGAATGGTKFGTVKAGGTELFDLNFFQVKQRLRRGAKFVLTIELRD